MNIRRATQGQPADAAGGAAAIANALYHRRVEFAETDAAGMVHFSVFFRYMEEAEHAVWRSAGMDICASRETNSWPRISAHFDFKAPLRFQDEFEVRTEIAAVTEHALSVCRYIIENPVRAGLVSHPAEYPLCGSTQYTSTAISEAVMIKGWWSGF